MEYSYFFLKQAIKGLYKIPLFELARHSRWFIKFIPVQPIRATICVTDRCNSRCITCYKWKEKSQDELKTFELRYFLSQLRAVGINDLSLSGGEPLLRDDLPAIVRKACDLKFDRIQLITNGLLLTRERLGELVESGITSVYVSLNGVEDVHDTTRGIKGAYSKTMEALENLVQMRTSRFHRLNIGVQTIVMGLTVDQVVSVANICSRWDIKLSLSPFYILPCWQDVISNDLAAISHDKINHMIDKLHCIKRVHPSLLNDSFTSLEYIRDFFVTRKMEGIPCYLGYLQLGIGAHGEVFSGCWLLPPVGNLREASLKHIINSKTYKENVRDMFFKKCPGCGCDYILNLYAHLPSLLKEIKLQIRTMWVNSPVRDEGSKFR